MSLLRPTLTVLGLVNSSEYENANVLPCWNCWRTTSIAGVVPPYSPGLITTYPTRSSIWTPMEGWTSQVEDPANDYLRTGLQWATPDAFHAPTPEDLEDYVPDYLDSDWYIHTQECFVHAPGHWVRVDIYAQAVGYRNSLIDPARDTLAGKYKLYTCGEDAYGILPAPGYTAHIYVLENEPADAEDISEMPV